MTESEFLNRLYFKKGDLEIRNQLFQDLKEGRFEEATKRLENATHVPVFYITTKGKGERESFENARCLFADFGSMGNEQGLVYLYNEDRSFGIPKRFNYKSHRILIDKRR